MARDPQTRIKQARAHLLRTDHFLGALALRLEPLADPSLPYLGTDGRTLRYNPTAIAEQPLDVLALGVAHEVAHCQLQHFGRRGGRDPERWNVAADYAANARLVDAGHTLPKEWLFDAAYAGMSAERIYSELGKNPPTEEQKQQADRGRVDDAPDPQGAGKPNDKPDGQGDQEGPGQPQEAPGKAAADLCREWQEATAEAEMRALAKGTMPGALSRKLSQERKRPQSWREILAQYAADHAKHEARTIPPNRRHVWRGAYLPSLRGLDVGTLVAVFDTSSSIGRAEIARFVAECRGILDSGIVAELVVMACDTRAHLIGRYTRGEDIPIESAPGGGGTDFRPPFRLCDELGIRPTVLAYLTDMIGKFPEEAPDYPVLWVSTLPDQSAPFGAVLDMAKG